MASLSRDPFHIDEAGLDKLAEGLWGVVYKARGAKIVIKVQLDLSEIPRKPNMPLYKRLGDFYEVEKSVFERLGNKSFIAHYLGECVVSIGGKKKPGLVIEYYEPGTLRELLESSDPVTKQLCEEKKFHWAAQVLEALQHIHSRAVIHGDLGCHNILVDEDYNLRFADFAGSSMDGSIFLLEPKAAYHRPQRHTWRDLMETAEPPPDSWTIPSVKSDLFALGAILYELMIGEPVFMGLNRIEIREKILKGEHPNLSAVQYADARKVVEKCRREQYETVAEVQKDFDPASHSNT